MENVVTILIILLIAAVSVIGKVRSKQKSNAPAQGTKSGGWGAKLGEFINQIQERIEQETDRNRGPTTADQWRRLMEQGTMDGKDRNSLHDLEFVETAPAVQVEKRSTRIPPTPAKKQTPVETPPMSDPIRQSELQIQTQLSLQSSELRKAVIWAEVLGPPVALRERSDHRG